MVSTGNGIYRKQLNSNAGILLTTTLAFLGYSILNTHWFRLWRNGLLEWTGHIGISHFIAYIGVGAPFLLIVLLHHGWRRSLKALGFDRPLLKALVFACVCTAPMFIGSALFFEPASGVNWDRIWIAVIAAGFFEEMYFRGFLFGQIYRNTKAGFILSVLPGALLFAMAHLYQGRDTGEIVGVFLVTFLGGGLFAWTYAEWDNNLWVPVFLHMLMNLSWELFQLSETALGGGLANIFRGMTIAMVIVLTLLKKRRNAEALSVNRKTLWLKRPD